MHQLICTLLGFKVSYSNAVVLNILYYLLISMLVLFKWPIRAFKITQCIYGPTLDYLRISMLSSDSVPQTLMLQIFAERECM